MTRYRVSADKPDEHYVMQRIRTSQLTATKRDLLHSVLLTSAQDGIRVRNLVDELQSSSATDKQRSHEESVQVVVDNLFSQTSSRQLACDIALFGYLTGHEHREQYHGPLSMLIRTLRKGKV